MGGGKKRKKGMESKGQTEILGPLTVGDQLVTNANEEIRDGVEIGEVKAASKENQSNPIKFFFLLPSQLAMSKGLRANDVWGSAPAIPFALHDR